LPSSTLDWLEKSDETRDRDMPYPGFPVFDSVRSDPRFKAIARGANFPQ